MSRWDITEGKCYEESNFIVNGVNVISNIFIL